MQNRKLDRFDLWMKKYDREIGVVMFIAAVVLWVTIFYASAVGICERIK